MGILSAGDDDSQRTFNGKLIEELRAKPSKQAKWTAFDRIEMRKWLALHKHSEGTINQDDDSIMVLMCQIGLHKDLLSDEHYTEMKRRLRRTLKYMVEQLAREHQLEVYWDVDRRVKRLKWRDEVVHEIIHGNI
ncbi:hypothetical protein CEP51_016093 [Fusarium floridanum]|uniref:Uncharacterized protein n=1 Tax=Fusarium floridanum TaxID=1325733 RepID=A0A428NX80_9HYPO|nr:hypothetical protein CEP51_016093 [Fusarium floridanum]